MTNKIHLLSAQVASQIAAGEVIERPASIVKELLENSIDAGSDHITVLIKNAGNSLISITDNGNGISKEDLSLAICQHATSKLKDLSDLDAITSLGFRGEALASICSVAKLKITSKSRNIENFNSNLQYSQMSKQSSETGCAINSVQSQEVAWTLESKGNNNNYKIVPASHPVGTTIEVRDLFFNMPVRRRFLKSNKTEYQHILEIFQKISLSNFNCGFTLVNEDKVIYRLPKAANLAARTNRVRKVFGSSFINNMFFFEGEAASISLKGWLSNSDYHRSQSDQQYFFLNNRVVRDKLILHAIKFVYENILPAGRHPCYVLYLNIEPKSVDVNVHPTKHEVRFSESRWVHQFIVQQLTNVLLGENSRGDYNLESNCLDLESMPGMCERTKLPQYFGVSDYAGVSNVEKVSDDKGMLSSAALRDDFSSARLNFRTMPGITENDGQTEHGEQTGYGSESEYSDEIGNGEIVKQSGITSKDSRSKGGLQERIKSNIIESKDHITSNITHNNYGNIIAKLDNNFIICKNDKNICYIVDLNLAYQYLAYNKLKEQWHLSNKLLSSNLMITADLTIEDLFNNISKSDSEFKYLSRLGDRVEFGDEYGFKPKVKLSKGLDINLDVFLNNLEDILSLVKVFGFDFSLDYKISKNNSLDKKMELCVNRSGEVFNSIRLIAVPSVCRYANVIKLFILVISLLFKQNVLRGSLNTNTNTNTNTDFSPSLGFNSDKLEEVTECSGLDYTSVILSCMTELAFDRLESNLLYLEQAALLDKLAKKDYNELELNGVRVVKSLLSADCFSLMQI